MKYIKTYEKLSIQKRGELRELITTVCEEIIDTGDENFYECPFASQLAIIHQEYYIDEIYNDVDNFGTYTYEEYSNEFRKLIEESKNIVLNIINNNPDLYDKCRNLINFEGVPEWLKSYNKYNL